MRRNSVFHSGLADVKIFTEVSVELQCNRTIGIFIKTFVLSETYDLRPSISSVKIRVL